MTYLASHGGSVLLIDEPDAHFEILRQRQVYVILRDLASESGSQVVVVTHSEVLLDEALETSLTLLVDGRVADQPRKNTVKQALKHFGTAHYVRAKLAGHILYVEGSTDVDILRSLAHRMDHPALAVFEPRLNAYYVEDNYPESDSIEAQLARVEGAYGKPPAEHFHGLRTLVPGLRGLAILDNDGKARADRTGGELREVYWRRYEVENYFVTPDLLARYARAKLTGSEDAQTELFAAAYGRKIDETLDALVLERVFAGKRTDFETYRTADDRVQRLLWNTATRDLKLSLFAEEFFERLAASTETHVLLRKGGFHALVRMADPASFDLDVTEKLDLLVWLCSADRSG